MKAGLLLHSQPAMFHPCRAIAPSTFALIALAALVMAGCGSVREGFRGQATVAQIPAETTEHDCGRPPSDRSYVAACVSTGTRADTAIREVPHSTQVITRPVIEDQKALRLCDALRNVSGVQCR